MIIQEINCGSNEKDHKFNIVFENQVALCLLLISNQYTFKQTNFYACALIFLLTIAIKSDYDFDNGNAIH